MNCIDLISNSLTIIASSLEAYGAFKTIKIKSSNPLKIKKSNIERDIRSAQLASLGDSNLSERELIREIESENNRIINDYNRSVDKLIEDTNTKDNEVSKYFKFIFAGFIVQIISVLLQFI